MCIAYNNNMHFLVAGLWAATAQLGFSSRLQVRIRPLHIHPIPVKLQKGHLGVLPCWMATIQESKYADTFTASLKCAIGQVHSPRTGQSSEPEKCTPPQGRGRGGSRPVSKPSGKKIGSRHRLREPGKFLECSLIRHLAPYRDILYRSEQATAMTPKSQGFIKTEV